MGTERRIRASARRIVAEHGRDAWNQAVERTEASAASGDWQGVAEWRQIGGAIRTLDRIAAAQATIAANSGVGLGLQMLKAFVPTLRLGA